MFELGLIGENLGGNQYLLLVLQVIINRKYVKFIVKVSGNKY